MINPEFIRSQATQLLDGYKIPKGKQFIIIQAAIDGYRNGSLQTGAGVFMFVEGRAKAILKAETKARRERGQR